MSNDDRLLSFQTPRDIPPRHVGSVRRTSSIEIAWPDGRDGSAEMTGRARDVLTLEPAGPPRVLAEDRLSARIAPDTTIEAIETDPPVDGIARLVGQSAIVGLRRRLRDLPALAAVVHRPLALLLDDLVGCNVISGWVWTKWIRDPAERAGFAGDARGMENACISYATGSSVLGDTSYLDKLDIVPPLQPADDPHAFHPLAADRPQTMRRVRLIDVRRDGPTIAIAAMFQDSGMVPGDRRCAVHEYALHATADAATGALLSLDAVPGALPHAPCVAAPAGLTRLIGVPLDALRDTVLRELRGPVGCTHLNDAVRSLAEASLLVRHPEKRRPAA